MKNSYVKCWWNWHLVDFLAAANCYAWITKSAELAFQRFCVCKKSPVFSQITNCCRVLATKDYQLRCFPQLFINIRIRCMLNWEVNCSITDFFRSSYSMFSLPIALGPLSCFCRFYWRVQRTIFYDLQPNISPSLLLLSPNIPALSQWNLFISLFLVQYWQDGKKYKSVFTLAFY